MDPDGDRMEEDQNQESAVSSNIPIPIPHASENYYPEVVYPPLDKPSPESEWDYFARRTCQEILPGLYLGPYASATRLSKDDMVKMNLTHVVCVRSLAEVAFVRPNHPELFKYLVLELNDNVYEGIIPSLKKVIEFLDDCFNNGGRALVHGNAGMSRSAAMVVGYVMWRHGVNVDTSFRFVQHKRFCIQLNDGFMNQLRDFESMVKAVQMVPPSDERRNKRSAEDDGYTLPEKHSSFNNGDNNNH